MMLRDGAEWRCCGWWRLSSCLVNDEEEANKRQQTQALLHACLTVMEQNEAEGRSVAPAASCPPPTMEGGKARKNGACTIIGSSFPHPGDIFSRLYPNQKAGRAVAEGSIQNIQELDWKSKKTSAIIDQHPVSKHP